MKQIESETPSVSKLLGDTRYNIDYYQREYRWERRQVAQLLDDLFSAFRESHDGEHARDKVATYGQYFLGPIIVNCREAVTDIVDGQQRVTTLTLLLIALRRRIQDENQRGSLANLVVTHQFGQPTFTLDVPERAPCMDALYTEQVLDPASADPAVRKILDSRDPSVRNILDRFADVEELLDGGLDMDALPYFADWLMYRVKMVSVIATSEADAYTIFETMNDRGLRLTAPEMLRGYLLSRIEDETERSESSQVWKERVSELAEIGKEEDVDAIQAWLRGRRAETASRYVAGVEPGDYERIGNEFHRWVRDVEEDRLALRSPSNFADFIRTDFDFYVGWYARLRRAAETTTNGLETIQYIASQGFTLQYSLLLAALDVGDSEDLALRKIGATAAYIDILIHRRLWNSMRIGQTYLRFPLFDLAKKVRAAESIEQLVKLLTTEIEGNELGFSPDWPFARNRRNGNIVRRMLARLTSFVERDRPGSAGYAELLTTGRDGYDIEHVIADKPERYADEFANEAEFDAERNWIGGLLLIPSSVNRSFGDLAYEPKREHYLKENWLAASLHEAAYKHNPKLKRFAQARGLELQAYPHFGRAELDARQELYEQIAAEVWRVDRIKEAAGLQLA